MRRFSRRRLSVHCQKHFQRNAGIDVHGAARGDVAQRTRPRQASRRRRQTLRNRLSQAQRETNRGRRTLAGRRRSYQRSEQIRRFDQDRDCPRTAGTGLVHLEPAHLRRCKSNSTRNLPARISRRAGRTPGKSNTANYRFAVVGFASCERASTSPRQ